MNPLQPNWRTGTVVAVLGGVPARVSVAVGGDTANPGTFPCLDGYVPVVGDTVHLLTNQGSAVVLGAVSGPAGHVDFTNTSTLTISASTAASYVGLTNSTSAAFTKSRAGSRLRIDFDMSIFASTAAIRTQWGIQLVPTGTGTGLGSTATYDVGHFTLNATGAHTQFHFRAWISGVAADTYTASVRFYRSGLTGAINADTDDTVTYEIDEVT